MKTPAVLLLFASLFLTYFSLPAFAQQTSGVTITKTVLNPQTNAYVKTLNLSDGVYQPGNSVIFHITLINSGNENQQQVIVKDTFPSYLNFSSGPGSYDQKNSTLSFLAYNLKPGTSQTFAVTARIASADQFPSDKKEICLTNKASMLFGQNQTAQDQAEFCIANNTQTSAATQTTKGGQPVFPPASAATTPSTGPNSLIILALLSLSGTGYFLIRKSYILIK